MDEPELTGGFSVRNQTGERTKKPPMKTVKNEILLGLEELEERIAPTIVLTNPGGNEPQGNGASNGVANDYENPAGHAPSGWNK